MFLFFHRLQAVHHSLMKKHQMRGEAYTVNKPTIASHYSILIPVHSSAVEAEALPPAPTIQVIPEETATSPPMAIDPQVENTRKSLRPNKINIGPRDIVVTPTLPSGGEAPEPFGYDRGTYSLTRQKQLEK